MAIAGGEQRAILGVYDDAIRLLGTPRDTSTMLAKAFLAAASKLKNKELRKALTARVYAAAPNDAASTP